MMTIRKLTFVCTLICFILLFFQFEIRAQEIEKKLNIDIVFIGNSITEGALLEKPQQEAPPVIASEYLRQREGVGEVNFINYGRSGYTTFDFMPSKGGVLEEVIAATHQLHKDNKRLLVFSISLGTNDSAEKGPHGSPVCPKVFHKNLHSIIKQLFVHFPDCGIILQQPIWYSPNTYNTSEYLEKGLSRLQSYFPELQEMVFEYSMRKPNRVFLGNQKGFEYFNENHLTNFVPEVGKEGTFYLHPNKKGAAVLGNFWTEAIYEYFLFELNSFSEKMIGYGAELSVLSFKPNVRMWISKTKGFEVFGGVSAELGDYIPKDFEGGFKLLNSISNYQTNRSYFGLMGKWKWVNLEAENNVKTNLPVAGVFIGKEWYSKTNKHSAFAIELGYQYGVKNHKIRNHFNNDIIGEKQYIEFPLILNLRYSFYKKR